MRNRCSVWFGVFVIELWTAASWAGDNVQVNQEDHPATFVQRDVTIDHDDGGKFVAAWTDCRNGVSTVYAQRFDSTGAPIGQNFLVSEGAQSIGIPYLFPYGSDNGILPPPRSCVDKIFLGECCKIHSNTWFPSIAVAPDGDFAIAWSGCGNDQVNVYVRLYDAAGAPQSESFIVNEGSFFTHTSPAIACGPQGELVVVWFDNRNGDSDIYVQRFTADGTPQGGNIKVNDDETGADQLYPALCWLAGGGFLVAWGDDGRAGGRDVYVQRYDVAGLPLETNAKVNSGDGHHYSPSVTCDGEGNVVVAWANGLGNASIYAQIYGSSGSPLGGNFVVSDDAHFAWSSDGPSVSSTASGNFVICWTDSNGNVFAQRYAPSGTHLDTPFLVNGDSPGICHDAPVISCDPQGGFVVAFGDDYQDNKDVCAQRYDLDGNAHGGNFRVNDDETGSNEDPPSMDVGPDGSFVIAWADRRSGPLDIYAQRYGPDGAPQGGNFKVNEVALDLDDFYPFIVPGLDFSPRGFIIAWPRKIDDNVGVIYAQRYDIDGNPMGKNFRVMDEEGKDGVLPSIASDTAGSYVVCWEDLRVWENRLDIFAQRYNAQGESLGGNFRVNDVVTNTQINPSVACFPYGGFVVTWRDDRASGNFIYDVYAQRFDADGTPQGHDFKVNDDDDLAFNQIFPSICCDGRGNFIITWNDDRRGDWDIYAQRYDSLGNAVGNNFKVNDDETMEQHYQLSQAVARNFHDDFVVCWADYRNGDSDIYFQQYNGEGLPIGSNRKANDDLGDHVQWGPAVALDNVIYLAWSDNRNPDQGFDIYAAIMGCQGYFVRGDVQADDDVDIFDAMNIIYWLGGIAPQPVCKDAADVQDDNRVSLGDGIQLLYHTGGLSLPPSPPFPECGPDPTPDALGCSGFPPCKWDLDQAGQRGDTLIGNPADSRLAVGRVHASNDGRATIPVDLLAAEPLIAFRLLIQYDPLLLTAKYGDNTQLITEGFDLFTVEIDDVEGEIVILGVADLDLTDGIDRLPAGAHRIVNIGFELDEELLSREVSVEAMDVDLAVDYCHGLSRKVVHGAVLPAGTWKSNLSVPQTFSMDQNRPNPFNPETEIVYTLPRPCRVELNVFDILGQKVLTLVDEAQSPGRKVVRWRGRNQRGDEVGSGVYLCRISAGEFKEMRKMVLIR